MAVQYTDAFTMTSPDYEDAPTVQNAVRDWNKGLDFLFEFAVKAYHIVGRRDGGTEKLAKLIKREVDTVERYAAAGCLWLDILKEYPSDSELLRDTIDVSFWMAIGTKYKSEQITLEQAKNYLETSYRERWTVEKTRAMLPTKDARSPFQRAMKKLYTTIEKDILNAPALNSGMDDKEYRMFLNTVKWLMRLLEGKI